MGRTQTVDFSKRRTERRDAARREGRGDRLVLKFGPDSGPVELGPEFPLDVLEPLQDIDVDLALLIREAIKMSSAAESDEGMWDVVSSIVEILVVSPNLPKSSIAAAKEMARRLLGEDGYAALVAFRPSLWDVSDLVSTLTDWYGLSAGESSRSTTQQVAPGGPTSNSISGTTSGSTPGISGATPVIPGSSESAA